MSYQIKSTPYFRRMFNNSKKNGQLQRLREEYERIQEFNDRTIELKMRQVRLKRLFRQIEEIKGSAHNSTHGLPLRTPRRRPHASSTLTPERQLHNKRLETLARAKELGKEISRRNAEMAENGQGHYLRSELRVTGKQRAAADAKRDAVDRRERTAMRIRYGNEQSKSNLERLTSRRKRRQNAGAVTRHPTQGCATTGSIAFGPMAVSLGQQLPQEEKRARLQQRLEYGNSRSSSNMARVQASSGLAARLKDRIKDLLEEQEERDEEESAQVIAQVAAPEQMHQQYEMVHQTDTDEELETAQMPSSDNSVMRLPSTGGIQLLNPHVLCNDTRILRMLEASSSSSNSDSRQSRDRDQNLPSILSMTTALANYNQGAVFGCGSSLETINPALRWHRASLMLPWIRAYRKKLSKMSKRKELPALCMEQVQRKRVTSSSSYEDLASTTRSSVIAGALEQAPLLPVNQTHVYKNVRQHVLEHEALIAALNRPVPLPLRRSSGRSIAGGSRTKQKRSMGVQGSQVGEYAMPPYHVMQLDSNEAQIPISNVEHKCLLFEN